MPDRIRARFVEAFGLEVTLEEERERFVRRVHELALRWVINWGNWRDGWVREVCVELGITEEEVLAVTVRNGRARHYVAPIDFTGMKYTETLLFTTALMHVLQRGSGFDAQTQIVNDGVRRALALSSLDLGISWNGELFYPTGARELDAALVDAPLKWLALYPKVRTLFEKAIIEYSAGHVRDCVTNCFLSLEGYASALLGNTKTLDNNKKEFLAATKLSGRWVAILKALLDFMNEYARHEDKDQPELAPHEAEAVLYMTGTLLRASFEAQKSIRP